MKSAVKEGPLVGQILRQFKSVPVPSSENHDLTRELVSSFIAQRVDSKDLGIIVTCKQAAELSNVFEESIGVTIVDNQEQSKVVNRKDLLNYQTQLSNARAAELCLAKDLEESTRERAKLVRDAALASSEGQDVLKKIVATQESQATQIKSLTGEVAVLTQSNNTLTQSNNMLTQSNGQLLITTELLHQRLTVLESLNAVLD